VLSIVVLVLAQAHEELGVHFAVVQKPFFRLFSSILSNLHNVETHLGPAYSKVLVSMR
jgi:CCR4-NOT transcription complex subunit 1